jgi:hypothetical protein
MSAYFFDVLNGDHAIEDDQGVDFPNVEAALIPKSNEPPKAVTRNLRQTARGSPR